MATDAIEWGGRIVAPREGRTLGHAKRSLYKRERKPARVRGVLGREAPLGVPDATPSEIINAICIVAKQFGLKIGQGGEYDRQRDQYVVIGKTGRWSMPQDYVIPGEYVAAVILNWRKVMYAAGPLDPRGWLVKKGLLPKPSLPKLPSSAPHQQTYAPGSPASSAAASAAAPQACRRG